MRKNLSKLKLRDMVELVQQKGQGEDKVLAHINPEEAHELANNYGYDINPHTGLPQFGGFKKLMRSVGRVASHPFRLISHPSKTIKHDFRNIQRILHSAPIRTIAPILGGIVGSIYGGPMGGAAGGAIGRAITRRDSVGKNLLKGGLMGGAMGYGGQMMGLWGNTAGAAARGGLGAAAGAQGGSGGGGFLGGLKGMLGMGGGAGAGGALGGGGAGGGILSSLGGPLNAALLGTMIGGTLGRKEKVTPQQIQQERRDIESIRNLPVQDMSVLSPRKWGEEDQYRKVKPYKRRYVKPPDNYMAGQDPEFDIFPDENPEVEYYKEGGYVHGEDGGQSDKVRMDIPDGSYVMDATTMSLLGDGNSLRGKKIIEDELERKFLNSGIIRNPQESKNIKAFVSSGEHVLKPEIVTAMGKGNNEKGAKKLDKMRRNVRKHKGVKPFLPPKSKKLKEYMR